MTLQYSTFLLATPLGILFMAIINHTHFQHLLLLHNLLLPHDLLLSFQLSPILSQSAPTYSSSGDSPDPLLLPLIMSVACDTMTSKPLMPPPPPPTPHLPLPCTPHAPYAWTTTLDPCCASLGHCCTTTVPPARFPSRCHHRIPATLMEP
jgi:hypothetical protein